ncbi:leucine-rich repeat domain-containing protein [Aristaeella hokkaidonensis]|uniref:Leucine-rich repeat domain-containing protein n=1 Tax=Aristaeella hokkaidonensis TaxID=3046382 RepID=A0AC61N0C9_9FIRM|nr:leucine-rich repeat domain-containing protein [Aristaeella hokkaidonensis]QUC66119.1 leucine-rich repeat domain-containing protein [Aristaeella hokkaidonensis]SNT94877.1 Leucine rich repeat-containing protein [Aristaeella hokkaidonensis]
MERASIQLPDWEHAVLNGKLIDSEEAEHILIKGPLSIPASSFCLFDNLKSVEIADDVLGIEKYSFRYCQSLKTIQFGKGIQFIEGGSFCGCHLMETLTIPGNVQVIGESAFKELSSLKSLHIEEGVQTIDWYAFSQCGELENVVLPKESIKKVGGFTFSDSKWIKNHPDDFVIVGDTFIRYCGGDTDHLKIPDSVREVAAGSLGYFTTIKEIDFGKNVKRIAGHIFHGDTGLKRIVLPEGLEEIGSWAFGGCYGLRNVTVPDSVLRVGSNAFRPEQFADCPARGCVYVGRALMSFIGDSKKVVIREGTYSISFQAFYRKNKLELVVLSDSIREIKGAFDSCTHLSTVVIPHGVPSSCLKDFSQMKNIKFITYHGSEADEYAKEKAIAVEYVDENMTWEDVIRKC